jgi:hypothetical protein
MIAEAAARIRAEAKTVIEYNRSEFAESQEELKGEIKSHLRQGQLPGTH